MVFWITSRTQGPAALTSTLARCGRPGTVRSLGFDAPGPAVPFGADHARTDQNGRTARFCVARVQHNQPRILHPAVRVLEGAPKPVLQGRPGRIACQIDCPGRGQDLSAAKVVVKKTGRSVSSIPGRRPLSHGITVLTTREAGVSVSNRMSLW